MVRTTSPLAQRRRLAQELRKLRGHRGISLDQVASELECDASWLSRVERAERGIRPNDVKSLLDVYQVTDSGRRLELLELARRAGARDWWHRFRKNLKPRFDIYLGLEADASTIRTYQTQMVPGILQTPGYTQAIVAEMDVEGAVDVDEIIAIRHARQEILRREDQPVHLVAVLDEAVLHRQVGDAAIVREQLRRLVELGKLPNVVIQVLPFDAGAHAAMNGAYVLLEFPESDDLSVVYLEQATSGVVLQSASEVRRYSLMFGNIAGKALSPKASAAMIDALARGRPPG
ncbi:MAG TPA: helix-turn-helix transcriptional regulator [Streptosporangiaceae bacterium]